MGDPFSLDGAVALITGGGTGVGAATALLLADRGANVVLAARHLAELEQTAQRIRDRSGRRALAVVADMKIDEDIAALVRRTEAEFDKIDVLVNNAGGTRAGLLVNEPTRAIDSALNLNLRGPLLLTREVGQRMVAQRAGAIVNISSGAGVTGMKGGAAYSAAKAGLQMLTRVTAAELGPYGVRANCVALGPIATERAIAAWNSIDLDLEGMTSRLPLRRVGTPEEVAYCVLFLASSASSYVTGQTFACDGGPILGGVDIP